MISACPKCILAQVQNFEVLTFIKDGIVSCPIHGEMTTEDYAKLAEEITKEKDNVISLAIRGKYYEQ